MEFSQIMRDNQHSPYFNSLMSLPLHNLLLLYFSPLQSYESPFCSFYLHFLPLHLLLHYFNSLLSLPLHNLLLLYFSPKITDSSAFLASATIIRSGTIRPAPYPIKVLWRDPERREMRSSIICEETRRRYAHYAGESKPKSTPHPARRRQNPINDAIDGAVDSVITSAASFLLGDPTGNLTAAQTSDHLAQFCSVDVVNSAANQPRFYFYMAPYRQQSDSDGFNVHSPQLRQ